MLGAMRYGSRMLGIAATMIGAWGCGDDGTSPADTETTTSVTQGTGDPPPTGEGTVTSTSPTTGVDTGSESGMPEDTGTSDDTGPVLPDVVSVHLVPQDGISGLQRVAFAIPLPPGMQDDETLVRVEHEGVELPVAARALARHAAGGIRSLELQVDVEIAGETDLSVELGIAGAAGELERVPTEDTLVDPDGTLGPRVWALLPAAWLSASGFAGPQLPVADTPAEHAAWDAVCDYAAFGVDAFLPMIDDPTVWLYDRGTTFWRAHARTGDLDTLATAYRESALYRAGLSGSGAGTTIGLPAQVDDLKYHYAQNLALHYLATGDDRFREAAEDVAERAHALWGSPGYEPPDFWTERHAGFGLLASVWAAAVSDDQADTFIGWADEAVAAYAQMQATFPEGYEDPDARCFAHHADDHGEDYGYFGCSPWMSAILADGLEQYAIDRGGAEPDTARQSLVQLGRIVARDGLDGDGRPMYWMGVGTDADEPDDYDEHWGESAYVVALAWHHDGRGDATLRDAAQGLIDGLAAYGSAPHMRSFNWQCRSAVATPWYLQ
jgi:hypothetical protein